MAPNMEQTARICFPAARRVTGRFHVQKLAYEAVREMRVKARWEALDEESIQIAHAGACGKRERGFKKTAAGQKHLSSL